ncbi:putative UDP-rhamnose:rhamnosyltransferase 1 [Phoenix dactylifera]|uniref:Glycosyltransferase n=1 Tax=Phoenix dactylifera TaxID=42345 RepID=A0A8B7D1U5_PHODC|nr:putative UDP-rhamnose:rhamnosyltransferase 1 [Phoenix dactylifera]
MGEGPLHIVLFPWLAFGHLIPFLELSKSLAKRGHHIFFISTPRNIHRLPNIPLPLLPLIDFISIPLPPSDDLPDHDAEATADLPPHKVPHLKKAFDKLDQPVAEFLEQASPKPDWIICDFAPYWLPPIASKLNTPCAYFNTFPSFSSAFSAAWQRSPEQLTATPEWIPFPTKVAYRLHEARSFAKLVHDSASGVSDEYRFNSVVRCCDLMAVRGCMEFDGEWLNVLPELYEKPIVPLGLLPPSADDRPDGENTNGMANTGHGNVVKWLNKQTPESVVYVSLGSEATLSNELVHELAFGLELSGLPFLWALRRKREEVELLPKGFEDRIAGRGVIAMGWMPQLEILACSSVGGFFTHCGWSSVVEGLAFGHPLILLPIFGDQGINARVMVEKKLGLEVERDEETGSFTREAVANVVRSVMVEDEGKKLRETAKRMREVFSNNDIHGRYVDAFVHYLRDHVRCRSLTV